MNDLERQLRYHIGDRTQAEQRVKNNVLHHMRQSKKKRLFFMQWPFLSFIAIGCIILFVISISTKPTVKQANPQPIEINVLIEQQTKQALTVSPAAYQMLTQTLTPEKEAKLYYTKAKKIHGLFVTANCTTSFCETAAVIDYSRYAKIVLLGKGSVMMESTSPDDKLTAVTFRTERGEKIYFFKQNQQLNAPSIDQVFSHIEKISWQSANDIQIKTANKTYEFTLKDREVTDR